VIDRFTNRFSGDRAVPHHIDYEDDYDNDNDNDNDNDEELDSAAGISRRQTIERSRASYSPISTPRFDR
jgi:hypothetical protein